MRYSCNDMNDKKEAAGKYIVLAESDVCPNEGNGMYDSVRMKREGASIINGKLQEDVVFDSPSGDAAFIIGAATNGWTAWKDENGVPIDQYRHNN